MIITYYFSVSALRRIGSLSSSGMFPVAQSRTRPVCLFVCSQPPLCLCWAGWSGRLCDAERDECAGAECLHGGRCVPKTRPPVCECPPGTCTLHTTHTLLLALLVGFSLRVRPVPPCSQCGSLCRPLYADVYETRSVYTRTEQDET